MQECRNNKYPDKTGIEPQGCQLYKLQIKKRFEGNNNRKGVEESFGM